MTVVTDSRWDVSVIIPAYNRAHLIGATLDAVLGQTHPPTEVIVVDDGSTDDTEAVVSRYGPPVQYHRIENAGVCRARNVGVRLSSAPCIAFCDSDDLWRAEKLEEQVRLVRQAPGVEYVFSDFVLVSNEQWGTTTKFDEAPAGFWEGGRRLIDQNLWVYDESLYARLLKYQPIFPSTVVMTRMFFERMGGIDEQWSRTVAEDIEFALRCVQCVPVGVVACPLVGIRKHAANCSSDHLDSALGELAILQHARLHHHPHGRQCADLIDEWIAAASLNAVRFAFAAGRMDIVRQIARTTDLASLSPKTRMKLAVARLPACLAQPLWRMLVLAAGLRPRVGVPPSGHGIGLTARSTSESPRGAHAAI